MKILLIGYGKMGKTIEQLATNRDHEIVGRIGIENTDDLKNFSGKNTDVAIEFTQPDSAVENIEYCFKNGIPVLSGTTGWLNQFDSVLSLCNESEGTFFYTSNYSIGVNLFFQLNEQLAKMMKTQSYDVSMEEIHHTEKLDEPSGTAITLAEGILKHSNRYKDWELGSTTENKIGISAKRIDPTPGTHSVIYSSEVDTIEIKHTAHSRKGFAMGAILVAEWLKDKKGAFSMKDFLKEKS